MITYNSNHNNNKSNNNTSNNNLSYTAACNESTSTAPITKDSPKLKLLKNESKLSLILKKRLKIKNRLYKIDAVIDNKEEDKDNRNLSYIKSKAYTSNSIKRTFDNSEFKSTKIISTPIKSIINSKRSNILEKLIKINKTNNNDNDNNNHNKDYNCINNVKRNLDLPKFPKLNLYKFKMKKNKELEKSKILKNFDNKIILIKKQYNDDIKISSNNNVSKSKEIEIESNKNIRKSKTRNKEKLLDSSLNNINIKTYLADRRLKIKSIILEEEDDNYSNCCRSIELNNFTNPSNKINYNNYNSNNLLMQYNISGNDLNSNKSFNLDFKEQINCLEHDFKEFYYNFSKKLENIDI